MYQKLNFFFVNHRKKKDFQNLVLTFFVVWKKWEFVFLGA